MKCSGLVSAALVCFTSIALVAGAKPSGHSQSPISATTTSPAATATTTPGYYTNFTTQPGNNFTFGTHYAVLNLDLINAIIGGVNSTAEGKAFIKSVKTWISAVHQQKPAPLSIFTRVYFLNTKLPDLDPHAPFANVEKALGPVTETSPATQLYPGIEPLADYDVVLQKSRFYAGSGNALELILSSQKIKTVIISGIRTSGVVLSTASRLADLNYQVYVISNNTIESAPDNGINKAILTGILPKSFLDVITVEQAIAALGRSGPAVY